MSAPAASAPDFQFIRMYSYFCTLSLLLLMVFGPSSGGKMTKALHVCRHLHRAGWRVVLVETHKYWHVGSRLSNCVDTFVTVPAPEEDPKGYVHGLTGRRGRSGVRGTRERMQF